MALHDFCRGSSRSWLTLTILLLCQCFAVHSKPTVKDTQSSILSDFDGKVPEYVTRYAPLVWLHSEDPFRPSDLLQHIQHTTAQVDGKPIPDLPDLNLDNLEILNHVEGGLVALTSKDDVTTIPAWLKGTTPDESGRTVNATPCVVILVEKTPRDIDAFFFYFYSYDQGPNITQVLDPFNQLIEDTEHGMHFGDHVGDWEHNMVRFQDGKPQGIYYSQHEGGAAYKWSDESLFIQDGRPLVYSAYGSHANYISEGDKIHDSVLVDYCDEGKLWDPALSAYFYHLEPESFKLTPLSSPQSNAPSGSNLTSFFYFDGRWGDKQYPDDHPAQKTVPYFGLKRFKTGPQGPLVKQLLRKGLMPVRGKKPWLQWAVGVFMSVYPCCIRGWRLWASLGIFVGLIVLVIFGVKRGIRYYRSRGRGYKRIETDIPLEEVGTAEPLEPVNRQN